MNLEFWSIWLKYHGHVVFALLLCKEEGISVTVQYVADFGSESSRNGTVRERKG
jgi:hypothetical protein